MPNNKIIDLDRLSRFKDKLDNVLETKANVDGNYPTMTVGSADNLTPYGENSGVEESTPFVFQSAGGSSDIGSQAQLRALRGKTIKWNQLLKDFSANNYWFITTGTFVNNNGEGTFTLNGEAQYNSGLAVYVTTKVGHKYLLLATLKTSVAGATLQFRQDDNYSSGLNPTTSYKTYSWFHTGAGKSRMFCLLLSSGVSGDTMTVKNCMCIDLTEIFGAGNEPTTLAEFARVFPKPYYPYNAGTLLSAKSNGYKTVGYNAFDGEWEVGGYDVNGVFQNSDDSFCSSINFIKVVAGQTYSFEKASYTQSSSVRFVVEYDGNKNFIQRQSVGQFSQENNTVVLTNNTQYVKIMCYISGYHFTNNFPTDIAFHLTWDSSRTGYEPYESNTYALPNVELRSAGSVYDELKPNGELIRRVGTYTFTGNETWNAGTGGYCWAMFNFVQNNGAVPQTSNNVVPKLLFSIYQTEKPDDITGQNVNKAISYNVSGSLLVRDTSITSASAMASAMAGKTILFELATPTTEQSTPFAETTPIDDYGTQEFLYDSDIAIPIPQGNDFFYPVDYKAFIDSLGGRDDIEYAADQVVSQTQLTQALSTFLSSIQGYDATKTQTLKNVSGVFQWVDD